MVTSRLAAETFSGPEPGRDAGKYPLLVLYNQRNLWGANQCEFAD